MTQEQKQQEIDEFEIWQVKKHNGSYEFINVIECVHIYQNNEPFTQIIKGYSMTLDNNKSFVIRTIGKGNVVNMERVSMQKHPVFMVMPLLAPVKHNQKKISFVIPDLNGGTIENDMISYALIGFEKQQILEKKINLFEAVWFC